MKYTVYIIRHISTGQVLYVGKTSNFKRRAYEHLKLNTHSKNWLSVIGTGNVLIEEVAKFNNKTDALKYEDELILKYNTIENGYNNNRSGLISSENPEEYQKEYQKEYRNTDEHKEYKREYQRKWDRKHRQTENRKEYQKKYQKKYQKNYQRDRYKAKKMGISIDEYRKLKENDQPIQLTINFS